LEPLRQRYTSQHYNLRRFYHECSNVEYLTRLLNVPKLEQEPLNFLDSNDALDIPPDLPPEVLIGLEHLVEDLSTADYEAPEDASLFECCLCTDTYTAPRVTMCMHVFCKRCVKRLIKSECPVCRTTFTSPPMRDALLEEKLAKAIEVGLVPAPSA